VLPRAAFVLLALGAAHAHAQDVVRTLPARSPSRVELDAMEPLLRGTIVTHVEHTEYVELPQVTVVAHASVGCGELAAVVRDVASYPGFMPAIDTVDVHPESELAIGYDWTWQASVLSFRGTATVTILEDEVRGFRAVFEGLDGDIGRFRRVVRGTPIPGGCRLVCTGRHDARDSNYLTRSASGSGLALSRSLSLVLSIATVTRLRGEAERRAGVFVAPSLEVLGDPRALSVDPITLAPLLDRGETFVLQTSDGTDLGAIVALTRLAFPAERVRAAFFDPVHFTVGLLSGASIRELSREERLARYGWSVDVPLLGSSGELTIRDLSSDELEIEATSGAMRGGRLLLTTRAESEWSTQATLAARIDPADGVPIVAAIESTDPAFRPGLVATGLLMTIRGLRRGLMEGH
jgi:hypothetical protein